MGELYLLSYSSGGWALRASSLRPAQFDEFTALAG